MVYVRPNPELQAEYDAVQKKTTRTAGAAKGPAPQKVSSPAPQAKAPTLEELHTIIEEGKWKVRAMTEERVYLEKVVGGINRRLTHWRPEGFALTRNTVEQMRKQMRVLLGNTTEPLYRRLFAARTLGYEVKITGPQETPEKVELHMSTDRFVLIPPNFLLTQA